LHLGTLLAVLIYFRKSLFELARGVLKGDWESRRYLILLIAGTIPVAVFGFLFRAEVERAFSSVRVAGALLMVTGTFLLAAEWTLRRKKHGGLDFFSSLVVGLAQAMALFPGISRSGITISIGILLGVDVKEAARFSFLLAIPAIAGAGLFSIGEGVGQIGVGEALGMLLGGVAALASGLLAIKFLLAFLFRGKLFLFALYCFGLGLWVLVWG